MRSPGKRLLPFLVCIRSICVLRQFVNSFLEENVTRFEIFVIIKVFFPPYHPFVNYLFQSIKPILACFEIGYTSVVNVQHSGEVM